MAEARQLEASLFGYHFDADQNSRATVIKALEAYQNPNGGFGRALEPDVRIQASSVVGTKFAMQILIDIQAARQDKLVQDGVAYLLKNYNHEKGIWPLVNEEVMSAPHAPWWDFNDLEREFGSFLANPKAVILRCLLYYGELVPNSFLEDLTSSLMAHFERLPVEMEFFDAISFLQLLSYDHLKVEIKGRLLSKLKLTAPKIVNHNPDDWHKFAIKPLWLAPSPNAPLADILMDDIQRNLDFEIVNQNSDGSWSPSWSWGTSYPEIWEKAEKEWKGILTLAMLRSLRDYGRIDGFPPKDKFPIYKYHID